MGTLVSILKIFVPFLKKYWHILLLCLLLGVTSASAYFSRQESIKMKSERDRYKNNAETLSGDFEQFKVRVKTSLGERDSIIRYNVARVSSLNYTLEEYKKYRQEDLKLISSLKLKLKFLKSVTDINIETSTKVSTKIDGGLINYKDQWLTLEGKVKGDSIEFLVKDIKGIQLFVSKVPAKKFLWWSWGTKGVQLNVVLGNPDSKVTYLKYIEFQK